MNALLCLTLVSKYELAGIAFASMFSATIHMMLMTYFGQKYYQSINHSIRTLIHMIIIILSAVSFYLFYDNRVLFIIMEIAMVSFCLIYDKKVVLWGLELLKSQKNQKIS